LAGVNPKRYSLDMGSTAIYVYINQTDPRYKRGGVAWLLLNKGILAGKQKKENCRSNNTYKEIGKKNINI
jgi:hypothetical protein